MIKQPKVIYILLFIALPSIGLCQLDINGMFVTDYVWRGTNSPNGSPAFQSSITYSFGQTGFSLNAWNAWVLTKRHQQIARDLDEMDITAAYN